MLWNEPATGRDRHRRAVFYVGTSFVLAVFGYVFLGFDQGQTLAYGVMSYAMLNALNYRAMFGRLAQPEESREAER